MDLVFNVKVMKSNVMINNDSNASNFSVADSSSVKVYDIDSD